MKQITKFTLLLFVISSLSLSSQVKRFNFFDETTGDVRIETEELDLLSSSLVKTQHRADDIVWSRIVYRVIDMREKQNLRFYFPVRPDHPTYRNLFKVILDAVCESDLSLYERGRELIPRYKLALSPQDLHANTLLPKQRDTDPNSYLIDIDDLGKPTLNTDNFLEYSRDVMKYLVQEVVFFNKHTSRMYTKIIGLAPIYSAHPDRAMATHSSMQSLQYSILFWVYFDELRPYLAKQYAVPNFNEVERLTLDDLFSQKMYSTYLLGDNNLYNRMLLDYDQFIGADQFEEFVKKEQKRLENELLNFEQDLWEH